MTEKSLTITDNDVGGYLKSMQESLSLYAVRDYNKDSFLKSAMLSIIENDDLKNCLKTVQGKASLFNALRYAASTGLSLNPQEGKACLIAYGGKVQYQIMKNGIVALAMESDKVKFITSSAVRENDEFRISKTDNGDSYSFSPDLLDRGEIIGFFAAVKFKDGVTCVDWMTVQEINEHRDKYSSLFKAKPAMSPWTKSYEGMGNKTILKKLLRNLAISDDLDRATGGDDAFEGATIEFEKNGYSSEDIAAELSSKPEPVPTPEPIQEPEPIAEPIKNEPEKKSQDLF